MSNFPQFFCVLVSTFHFSFLCCCCFWPRSLTHCCGSFDSLCFFLRAHTCTVVCVCDFTFARSHTIYYMSEFSTVFCVLVIEHFSYLCCCFFCPRSLARAVVVRLIPFRFYTLARTVVYVWFVSFFFCAITHDIICLSFPQFFCVLANTFHSFVVVFFGLTRSRTVVDRLIPFVFSWALARTVVYARVRVCVLCVSACVWVFVWARVCVCVLCVSACVCVVCECLRCVPTRVCMCVYVCVLFPLFFARSRATHVV